MLCKIQSRFTCFCKPSAAPHIYTLKLETSPHVVVPTSACKQPSSKKAEGVLKSCIRNPQYQEAGKKSVQWMDNIAEVKEFESRGNGTSGRENEEEEHSRRCVCIIL